MPDPTSNLADTLRRMQEKWGAVPNIPIEDLEAAAKEGRIQISQPSSIRDPLKILYYPSEGPAFNLPFGGGNLPIPESVATIPSSFQRGPFEPQPGTFVPMTGGLPIQLPGFAQAEAAPSVRGGTPTPLPPKEGPQESAGTITFGGAPGQPFTDPGTFEIMKAPPMVGPGGGDPLLEALQTNMVGALGKIELFMGQQGVDPMMRAELRTELASMMVQNGMLQPHAALSYIQGGLQGLIEPLEKQYQMDVAMGKMGVSELAIDRHAESIARNRFDQKGYGYKGILFKYEGGEVFKPNVKKDKKAMEKYQRNELVEGKHYEVYPLQIGKAGGPSMMPRAPGGRVSQGASVAQQDLERAGR